MSAAARGRHTLESRAVHKSFANGTRLQQVVAPCSLRVHPGELTLIVGPSGSGKSTLLSMLSGLLRPDGGEVLALDTALWTLSPDALDRFRLEHCGFVFQGFNLFASMTALDNVLLPAQYLGLPARTARERAKQCLAEVGLERQARLRPAELSGGEKQRVAIARALVKQPQLLFADEPTSALDGHNGQTVIDLMRRSAEQHGTTVLGVTHDPRLMVHADRVLTLEDGVLIDDRRQNPTHLPLDAHASSESAAAAAAPR
jgi:putative ABC transport system ATP-binding protein